MLGVNKRSAGTGRPYRIDAEIGPRARASYSARIIGGRRLSCPAGFGFDLDQAKCGSFFEVTDRTIEPEACIFDQPLRKNEIFLVIRT
jgi:hypothetical protein